MNNEVAPTSNLASFCLHSFSSHKDREMPKYKEYVMSELGTLQYRYFKYQYF